MPTMTSSSPVAGVCLVRNAADLIAYTCGHYLRIGFDRLTFLDDGSTDGTFEVLERISAKTDRVTVLRVDRFAHDRENQPELITSAVNELIDDGINIIIPFDGDEFWNLTAELVRNIAARHQEGLFVGHMLNFVQDRRVLRPHPFSLLRVRYRSPVLASVEPASARAYEVPLFARAPTKVGLKSHQSVQVGRGNHRLLQGPTDILLTNLEVFHIPLRAESEITRRAQDYGPGFCRGAQERAKAGI